MKGTMTKSKKTPKEQADRFIAIYVKLSEKQKELFLKALLDALSK